MTQRPRVICHMMATVDGRIDVSHWPDPGESRSEYERTAETYDADAWMCGRVTMQEFADGVRSRDDVEQEARPSGSPARPDYTAPGEHEGYAVALDPSGRLLWETGDIGGDHVVAVLSDRVSDAYLQRLREGGVSYLFASGGDGDLDLDLAAALHKLADRFGIETLLLEGGGRINGSFLQAGLVDEVSLLIFPAADGMAGTPSVFDRDSSRPGHRLALESVEQRPGSVVWLRYRVEPQAE